MAEIQTPQLTENGRDSILSVCIELGPSWAHASLAVHVACGPGGVNYLLYDGIDLNLERNGGFSVSKWSPQLGIQTASNSMAV